MFATRMINARVKIPNWCLAPDNPPHGGERPSLRLGCLILLSDVRLSTTSLFSPFQTIMDSTTNSTRVPAPAFSGPASNHDTQSVINDGPALNLPDDGICLMGGRALPDGKGASPTKLTSSRIVRCKKRTIISSLNTRTLDPLGRLEELAECSKRQTLTS